MSCMDEFNDHALDYRAGDQVINARRVGKTIRLAVTPGPVAELSADEAEQIGLSLLLQARAARRG